MNTILKYRIWLLIIPLLLILIYSYIADCLPKKSIFGKTINWFFDVITEKDLEQLMRKNGMSKTNVRTFQFVRIVISIIFAFLIGTIKGFNLKNLLTISAILVICYKVFYIYLVLIDKTRINKLNTLLPYAIKSISYLVYVYPVSNAIQKSIKIVPVEFRYDVETLFNDINNDPISFKPYQNLIDRYDGKLNNLESYMKTLYRLSDSGTKESDKLITNLNVSISNSLANSRNNKNQKINSSITYLGLIPVILMTLMLTYLMVMVVVSMKF